MGENNKKRQGNSTYARPATSMIELRKIGRDGFGGWNCFGVNGPGDSPQRVLSLCQNAMTAKLSYIISVLYDRHRIYYTGAKSGTMFSSPISVA